MALSFGALLAILLTLSLAEVSRSWGQGGEANVSKWSHALLQNQTMDCDMFQLLIFALSVILAEAEDVTKGTAQ